jgi:hypothetical protein
MNDLGVGAATTIGDITLVPLFTIQTLCIEQQNIFWLNGTVEPFAVVIIEPRGVRAVGVDEGELSVDVLAQKIPELDSVIRRWSSGV